jgi:hypothetical protein
VTSKTPDSVKEAVNRMLLLRALVRWAKAQNPSDLTVPLQGIVNAILENGFQNGRFLVSVNEAGGTVEFVAMKGYGPEKVMALCEETIEWLLQQPDPTNPRLNPRRLMRMTGGFGGYTQSLDAWFDRLIAKSK